MKAAIIMLTCVLFAGFLLAQSFTVGDVANQHPKIDPAKTLLAEQHIKAMTSDGSLTNVLHTLITNGTFCAIRGHAWGSHMHITLESAPGRVGCRECKVCGKHESRFATEWK